MWVWCGWVYGVGGDPLTIIMSGEIFKCVCLLYHRRHYSPKHHV